jgi:DnaJ-domain-containing protein 1
VTDAQDLKNMQKPQHSGNKSDAQSQKKRKESLERLINSYEQAKLVGDTVRMKMIKSIIDRAKNA